MKKLKKGLLTAAIAIAAAAAAFQGTAPVPGAAKAAERIPEGYTPIYDIADLQGINNDLAGSYILMNDIDLSETAPGGSWDSGHGWTPIGAGEGGFSGHLEGNGHYIKNMHIYGEVSILQAEKGLFSRVKGSISNLGLADCDIFVTHGAAYIGGIAGQADLSSRITGCFVTGKITSSYSAPGYAHIGGITGCAGEYTKIKDCYNYADVTSTEQDAQTDYEEEDMGLYAGGIAGSVYHAGNIISNCYNAGNIQGTGRYTGGIIGTGSGSLENIFYLNTSVSRGGTSAGGVGKALSEAQMRASRTFTGFDFAKTWYMDAASDYGYPQLRGCPQARVAECAVEQEPDRLEYAKGDELDLTGGVLSITYENGVKSQLAFEPGMITGYDKDKLGTQEVSVFYGNSSASFEVTVKEILADSLELDMDNDKCEINRGERLKLSVQFLPADVTDRTLTWKTSNELIASVSGDGTVKGLNAGTAQITAETKNGVQASCTVMVKVPAKSLKLNVASLTLKAGKKKALKASMTPLDATDKITWVSSSSKIAEVNGKGVVTAKRKGTAVIMAKTESRISKKVKVVVK